LGLGVSDVPVTHSKTLITNGILSNRIAVMLGVYVGGKSGGHLNPAVTFANCLYRGHPWRKFPVYALAQLLGAMTGAAIVYGNYRSAFDAFEGGAGIRTVTGPTATAGIFCTYPAAFMTRTGMFFSEFTASSILMFCIFALADPNNIGAGHLMPLCLFFLIFGIGACFGWETGYAMNLARDFGPRLVSFMIGYGHEVWSAGGYYFWVCRIFYPPCAHISPLLTMHHRFPWLPLSAELRLADSCTTSSSLRETAPSTRRCWVFNDCSGPAKACGPTPTRQPSTQKSNDCNPIMNA
jgi:MIP family channel proteins